MWTGILGGLHLTLWVSGGSMFLTSSNDAADPGTTP